LHSAPVTGSLTEPQLGDVTVIIGERRLQLTSAEASQLHDLLAERNLALLALQSELSRALQVDSEQPDVLLADEEMRQELFLCLDASEVFPVPRGPAKRYACRTWPEAIAFFSVRTTPSCPTTSSKS
jgi:hypothetical protein